MSHVDPDERDQARTAQSRGGWVVAPTAALLAATLVVLRTVAEDDGCGYFSVTSAGLGLAVAGVFCLLAAAVGAIRLRMAALHLLGAALLAAPLVVAGLVTAFHAGWYAESMFTCFL